MGHWRVENKRLDCKLMWYSVAKYCRKCCWLDIFGYWPQFFAGLNWPNLFFNVQYKWPVVPTFFYDLSCMIPQKCVPFSRFPFPPGILQKGQKGVQFLYMKAPSWDHVMWHEEVSWYLEHPGWRTLLHFWRPQKIPWDATWPWEVFRRE